MAKTQKIVVFGATRGKYEVHEVPATVVDIGCEFTTFVHKKFQSTDWAVSEKTTGNVVDVGDTRADAVQNARNKIEAVGRDNMRFAVERQQQFLAANNITL